jgi:hypothetical protein
VRRSRTTAVLSIDLALSAAAVLSTRVLDAPAWIADGTATLPSIWAAAVVCSWAIGRGWRLGLMSALVISRSM